MKLHIDNLNEEEYLMITGQGGEIISDGKVHDELSLDVMPGSTYTMTWHSPEKNKIRKRLKIFLRWTYFPFLDWLVQVSGIRITDYLSFLNNMDNPYMSVLRTGHRGSCVKCTYGMHKDVFLSFVLKFAECNNSDAVITYKKNCTDSYINRHYLCWILETTIFAAIWIAVWCGIVFLGIAGANRVICCGIFMGIAIGQKTIIVIGCILAVIGAVETIKLSRMLSDEEEKIAKRVTV